ncbi:hypothetical protein [Brachybacterium paraconglomeratum]|uniref:hypothetical protein n=1 Tax=Brachybacterium paraconglomeratum TaxID=173362 RepID=UPI0022AFD254|nr:hypothetical protein [Brachybacterium paraconglomeratum]MCZ4324759.1 hypothetical protein [Brachybacterium paraconglomeratum]
MTMHNVITINRAQITLGGLDVGDAVSSVALVPTATSQTWTPVSGVSQQKQGKASWAANVTLGQDYAPEALFRYLWDHEGEEGVTLEVRPLGGDGPSFTATVTSIPAAQLGGAADTIATSDVVFGLAGKPKVTWGTAPTTGA